jgi:phosphoglycerate kinase
MVKSLADLTKKDLEGKKVFVRVDFNVPISSSGKITDDTRIRAALPTINYLKNNGAKIILVSHLGRPKAKFVDEMRLTPAAARLSELMLKPVKKLNEAIGATVKQEIDNMQNGDVLMLENIRFYPGEEANDPDFSKELAELADIYVNDAFGTAHRAHASTEGVTSYLSPAVAGFLMTKELEMLGSKLANPERPFIAIIGGSKVSSKIDVLKNLVKEVDTLVIGGGMAFTFLKAQGASVGKSICEENQLDTAREIIALADQYNTALLIPEDTVCTPALDDNGKEINVFDSFTIHDEIQTKILSSRAIPDDMQGMDIGPKTCKQYTKVISQSKTVIWNGPVGVFEYDAFENGTKEISKALVELTKNGGTTIIGGGDSAAALEKFKIDKSQLTHVSTGGGASLEFLEGKILPGVACLDGFEQDSQAEPKTKNSNFAQELKKLSV